MRVESIRAAGGVDAFDAPAAPVAPGAASDAGAMKSEKGMAMKGDAMKGDATLFTRDDEIEEAWDLLDPVLNAWGPNPPNGKAPPVYEYPSGTWGPPAAADLLRQLGHRWRRL